MAERILVFTKVKDTRSEVMTKKIEALGFDIDFAKVIDVYTVNKDFSLEELQKIADMLSNPVSQTYSIGLNLNTPDDFEFAQALEIGFLPGVTDNVATTARESIEDLFKTNFTDDESIHTSQLLLIAGNIGESDAEKIGNLLANSLIQRIETKPAEKYQEDGGMEAVIPQVVLQSNPKVDEVDLDISEEELLKLGKEGVPNADGSRRGPLALDKEYLEAIKEYFKKEGRKPTDIELESIAQTWSEHCKHTIFASKIDDLADGLYKGLIKKATIDVRKAKGDDDFCVSVFSDNAGGIVFDDDWVVTDKAETHNTPSALDPFGGAITGIVGVNRDTIGFGLGAKPVINKYGFCVADPRDQEAIYRDADLKIAALSPRRIFDGIVDGVEAGGNQSGIPTPQGFLHFDPGYKGKPLVFVGTVGLIPRQINGKNSWEKEAQPGDRVIIIGGRVGQDGIHGATFSSETLDEKSPATAVQIGDPITQKKLSDAVIKEARDLDLYSSITDCGAGGISCSVAEMARECGGCTVELDQVPLKYPNLEPWKIWTSESQERMTFAIPPEKVEQFTKLMNSRGVEVADIGSFNNSGRCVVKFHGETIVDLSMEFLHDGLPEKSLTTSYTKTQHPEADFPQPEDLTTELQQLLARPNICSFEFITTQYDHNVQGGSTLKPLQGKGRVNSPTSVTKPLLESNKGVVCSQGINARYSYIDTYHMSASAIDTAIRNVISVGGNLDHLALMDNFCWCSSNEKERLGQLKASVQACYDYAVAYGTPYISGKDSMFNDFKGYDKDGKATKISVAPTLLISALSVIDDVTKSVSLDPKFAGDLVYILGETKDELAGSEYFDQHGFLGNKIPQVNSEEAIKLYRTFMEATDKRLIASALSPSQGGLGVALAKMAIAGQLGMQIDLNKVPQQNCDREDSILFSESQSRFIVTIDPKRQEEFEALFANHPLAQIGMMRQDPKFVISGKEGKTIIDTDITKLDEHYRSTFRNY
jgi:phosphoribosylformylglycinamidine synthase subunit PurSL